MQVDVEGEPRLGIVAPQHLTHVGRAGQPHQASSLIGHTDPTLTMRVYQHVLDIGSGTLDALERVLGCGLEEAWAIWSERADWALIADPRRDPLRTGPPPTRLE